MFVVAAAFLFFHFFPEIKATLVFFRGLYTEGKEWASTTFAVLSTIFGIVLSISFYVAIIMVIYMILSLIPIMKARIEFVKSKVSLVTEKVMQEVPFIKTVVNKIKGQPQSDEQLRRKAI